MRRALVVGINDYSWAPLKGCVNDAKGMVNSLTKHEDGSPNFHCKELTSDKKKVTSAQLRREIHNLFKREADVALLFFSGHGGEDSLGGYLVTQDAEKFDQGFPISEIIHLANRATHIREIIIILDCCYSGHLGNLPEFINGGALLRQGISLLTASRSDEFAVERDGNGLFTSMVISALRGDAKNLLGEVTIASTYSYVDKMLGPWEQRPVFKTHVTSLKVLRQCTPLIELPTLRRLRKYFEKKDSIIRLDPSFEPTEKSHNPKKSSIFSDLQVLAKAKLIEAENESHMYYAAINSKVCKMTNLGKLYWTMIENNRI